MNWEKFAELLYEELLTPTLRKLHFELSGTAETKTFVARTLWNAAVHPENGAPRERLTILFTRGGEIPKWEELNTFLDKLLAAYCDWFNANRERLKAECYPTA